MVGMKEWDQEQWRPFMFGSVCICIYIDVHFFPLSHEFSVLFWWVFLQGPLSEASGAPGRSPRSWPHLSLANGKIKSI